MQALALSLSLLLSLVVTVHGQCPNTSTLFASDGAEYLNYCGLDWSGNDLNHDTVANLTECINQCEEWTQTGGVECIGVSLVVFYNYAFDFECYLKESMPGDGAIQDTEAYFVNSAMRVRSDSAGSTVFALLCRR
jgi:hypothetical protein